MHTKNTPATPSSSFQALVWEYYAEHRRDMPWRKPESDGGYDAYKVMIS